MPGIRIPNLNRTSDTDREDLDGINNVVRDSNANFVRADNDNVNRDGSDNGGPVNGNGHLNVNGSGTRSSSRLNSNASPFSPHQAYPHHQSLREISFQDSSSTNAQYGAIGSASIHSPSQVNGNYGGRSVIHGTNGVNFNNGFGRIVDARLNNSMQVPHRYAFNGFPGYYGAPNFNGYTMTNGFAMYNGLPVYHGLPLTNGYAGNNGDIGNNGTTFTNGAHLTNGVGNQEVVDQDHASSSSTNPNDGGISLTSNYVTSSTDLPSSSSALADLDTLLATGPVTVSIDAEYAPWNANPAFPSFLHGVTVASVGQREWFTLVLPHISTYTFEIGTTTVLHYVMSILQSSQLDDLYNAVTKVKFPGFHQFSGIAFNRLHNPYFEFSKELPGLVEMTFHLHFAGVTTSAFGERQMIALERTNPERARERVKMSLDDVVRRYELNGIFNCRRLRQVTIEYVECERDVIFTRIGHPVDVLWEVQAFIRDGFACIGMNVRVELVRVD